MVAYLVVASFLLHSFGAASGVQIQAVGTSSHPLFAKRWSLNKRAQMVGDFGSVVVTNSSDLAYFANITVGGTEILVNIDTGSSDLWVNPVHTKERTEDTGKATGIKYGKGAVAGNLRLGSVSFAGYTNLKQVYLNATRKVDQPKSGILGLGAPASSQFAKLLSSSIDGASFIERVFRASPSAPNFLSFVLSRVQDPTAPFQAELTISQYIEGLEHIADMPKLPVHLPPSTSKSLRRWLISIDGVEGPDGKLIPLRSMVPAHTSRGPVALLDSGFSFPQVPKAVADAFYGRVKGAKFETTDGLNLWSIPCGQEINATFIIGGQRYPIHPLDITQRLRGLQGEFMCFGSFQPSTLSFGNDEFDMVLGMAFLRNTYSLFDYGDLDAATGRAGAPYIQLLPLTAPAEAHSDFVVSRLNGVDTTSDPEFALLPSEDGQISPQLTSTNRLSIKDYPQAMEHKKRMTIIIAVVVSVVIATVFGLALCFFCGCCLFLGIKRKATSEKPKFAMPWSWSFKDHKSGQQQVYQPLDMPAPQSHPDEYGREGKGKLLV